MTPEEKAREINDSINEHTPPEIAERLIAQAIREAITAEREACAWIADENTTAPGNEWGRGAKYNAEKIRDAIRTRK